MLFDWGVFEGTIQSINQSIVEWLIKGTPIQHVHNQAETETDVKDATTCMWKIPLVSIHNIPKTNSHHSYVVSCPRHIPMQYSSCPLTLTPCITIYSRKKNHQFLFHLMVFSLFLSFLSVIFFLFFRTKSEHSTGKGAVELRNKKWKTKENLELEQGKNYNMCMITIKQRELLQFDFYVLPCLTSKKNHNEY